MRRLMRHLLSVAGLLAAGTAQAASITVDGTNCSLADAITAANTDASAGNCPAGSGADTITLQTDVTLTADLPHISSTITIEGAGHFISGNNARRVLYIANTGNLTLNATTVKNGRSFETDTDARGGGIFNIGTITLTNSTVSGNTSRDGGGICHLSTGTVTLTNSTVSSNTASSNGGGIANWGRGTVTLTNSTVSGNTATSGYGGGIYNDGGTVTLTNSTVSSNTASSNGGGIDGTGGTVTLTNSTVSGNSAEGWGGGISQLSSGSVTLQSSIISGNTASTGGNEIFDVPILVKSVSFNVLGHSGETLTQAFVNISLGAGDVVATSGHTTQTALSSILGPLADNGGPTKTHALPAGSPAIDLSSSGACPGGLTTDQRGYSRPINFKCDAGAVEYSPSFSTASGNGRDLPKDTWLMTAPSCQPDDPADIGSQYGDDLGGSYGSTWIAYKWDAAAQQYPPPMAAAEPLDIAGIGNWIYSTGAGTLDISGTATPTEDCASCGWPGQQCFAIDLAIPPAGQSRWNLVGNPFPYAVNWADVRVSSSVNGSSWTLRTPSAADASVMRKTFHRWTGSAYEPKDDATPGSIGILLPQESVWIKTLAADPSITKIKLLIPAR